MSDPSDDCGECGAALGECDEDCGQYDGEVAEDATEQSICAAIIAAVEHDASFGENVPLHHSRVQTFNDAGVLTDNSGFELKLDNGRVFQVTVVRSR